MSPELISPQQFGLKASRPTKSSDCYSLGMVIYEVISGKPPFYEDVEVMACVKVLSGKHPFRVDGFADSLWGILEQCWTSQPNDRTSVEDVLQCLEACQNPSPQQTRPTAVPIQAQPQATHPQYPVQFQPTLPNFSGQPQAFQKVSEECLIVHFVLMTDYQGPAQMTQQPWQLHLYPQQQLMVQNPQIAGNVVLPSPLRGNTPQTWRSPMPHQQPGVAAAQHTQQPTTVQQTQSQPMYNHAAVSPRVARMTAMSQNLLTLVTTHALQAQAQSQSQGLLTDKPTSTVCTSARRFHF